MASWLFPRGGWLLHKTIDTVTQNRADAYVQDSRMKQRG